MTVQNLKMFVVLLFCIYKDII